MTNRSSVDQLADIGNREIAIEALLARVTAGELTKDRVKLAAYLGDPIARGALDITVDRERDTFDVWCRTIRELARACEIEWWTTLRASFTAAHEAFELWHDSPAPSCGCPSDPGIHGCQPLPETVASVLRVLETVEYYIDEPCKENLQAWSNACNLVDGDEGASEWLPVAYVSAERYMADVDAATDLVYEPHVRLAVRKDLVPWVLKAEVGPGFEIRGITKP